VKSGEPKVLQWLWRDVGAGDAGGGAGSWKPYAPWHRSRRLDYWGSGSIGRLDRIPAALKEPSGGRAKNMKYWGDGVF